MQAYKFPKISQNLNIDYSQPLKISPFKKKLAYLYSIISPMGELTSYM